MKLRPVRNLWKNYWRGNPRLAFYCMICVALFITFLRVINPLGVNYDMGLQLHAAHRLVAGQGLTISAAIASYDISLSATDEQFVIQAPLFPLIMSLILKTGIPLSFPIKGIYCFAFLAGWLGWGMVALPIFRHSVRWGERRLPFNTLLATLAPIYFSPMWIYTDIFLWSFMPYLIIVLAFPWSGLLPIILAGAGVAVLYLLRLASFFLLPVGCIFILFRRPLGKRTVTDLLVFFGTFALIAFPEFIYVRAYGSHSGFPPLFGVLASPGLLNEILAILEKCAFSLAGITSISNIDSAIQSMSKSHSVMLLPIGIMTLLFWVAHVVFSRVISARWSSTDRLVLFCISILPLAQTLFLASFAFLSKNPYWGMLEMFRYYIAVGISAPIVWYAVCSDTRRKFMQKIACVFFATFLVYQLVIRMSNRFDPIIRQSIVGSLKCAVGAQSYHPGFPLHNFVSGVDHTAEQVRGLLASYPEAICFAFPKPLFDCDGFAGIRSYGSAEFWDAAYSSNSKQVFFAIPDSEFSDDSRFSDVWKGGVIKSLDNLPGLRTISRDQVENMIILSADIPAGFRFCRGK
ncbi:MAG: hypothetical protein HQM09_17705 [Candidatus Riflebacteria bacterium]|nr:hypothetical protein [Candidatus Riflebacteria bacterium]